MKNVCSYTRNELFAAMVNRTEVVLPAGDLVLSVMVQGIEIEDGSGKNFNLKLYSPLWKVTYTQFMRCAS